MVKTIFIVIVSSLITHYDLFESGMRIFFLDDLVVEVFVHLLLGLGGHYFLRFVWQKFRLWDWHRSRLISLLVALVNWMNTCSSFVLLRYSLVIVSIITLCSITRLIGMISNLWSHRLIIAIATSWLLINIIEVIVVAKIICQFVATRDFFINRFLRLLIFVDVYLRILETSKKLFLLLHSLLSSYQLHLSLWLLSSCSVFSHPLHLEFKRLVSSSSDLSSWILLDHTNCMKLRLLSASWSWATGSRPALSAVSKFVSSSRWTHPSPASVGKIGGEWIIHERPGRMKLWRWSYSCELLRWVLVIEWILVSIVNCWPCIRVWTHLIYNFGRCP